MPGCRLTSEERAQIEVLYGQGLTFPQMAGVLGRDRSTVWRGGAAYQLRMGRPVIAAAGVRHGAMAGAGQPGGPPGTGVGYWFAYCHRTAQSRATVRAHRRRPGKLIAPWHRGSPRLWPVVKDKLVQRWSPMQIAAWLRWTYPDQPEMWVSHETIYQAIYYQARGEFRREIARQVALRSGWAARRPQSRAAAAGRTGKPWVADLHISTRPAEVCDRAVPGHWEGDLLIGTAGTSAIVTLVERSTRYVMLGALPDSLISDQVIDVLAAYPTSCARR